MAPLCGPSAQFTGRPIYSAAGALQRASSANGSIITSLYGLAAAVAVASAPSPSPPGAAP